MRASLGRVRFLLVSRRQTRNFGLRQLRAQKALAIVGKATGTCIRMETFWHSPAFALSRAEPKRFLFLLRERTNAPCRVVFFRNVSRSAVVDSDIA